MTQQWDVGTVPSTGTPDIRVSENFGLSRQCVNIPAGVVSQSASEVVLLTPCGNGGPFTEAYGLEACLCCPPDSPGCALSSAGDCVSLKHDE